MNIKWIGHACFAVESVNGLKIIVDPYTVSDSVKYPQINETADIVTVSHEHNDHNAVTAVKGKPEVLREPGKKVIKGIEFNGVDTFHDEVLGAKRGNNTVLCFTVDGITVCHMGDLGHILSARQVANIGKVDILLVPVGGYYTIDAEAATKVVAQINPRVIVPMHYKTEKLDFPIVSEDSFLEGKQNVRFINSQEVEYETCSLPSVPEIVVFQPLW